MRLLTLGIVLGVGGALFVACGGSDFSSGGGGKGKGGSSGTADAGEAGVGNAGAGGTSGSGSSGKGGTAGTDTDPGGAGGAPPQGGTGGGGEGGEGGDMTPPECTRAADCDDARGPAACGNWACNSMGACEMSATGCTDTDGDGYGAGTQCTCAGLDCDDDDAAVHGDSAESCYSGPSGTRGIGTCQAGNRVCVAGVWGPCTGEVVPSGEACNGEDDDCDTTADNGLGQLSCGMGKCRVTVAACTSGLTGICAPNTGMATADDCSGTAGVDDDCDGGIDEDCTIGPMGAPTCFRVAPTGNDTAAAADATYLTAFATVQAAIDFADMNRTVSTRVCIAPGAACGANTQFPSRTNQPILMKDGISVYGNYQYASWGRCTNSRTRLRPESPLGVSFAFTSAANSTTVLDGVEIDRDDTPTTAGVTVDAARGVIVSNVVIENVIVATNTYGVNVVNSGQATIFRSRITGGNGSVESIGVRSAGAQVFIEDNCLSPDPTTGRCDDFCNATNPSIRSRTANGTGAAYSVFLASSPGSKIERSALCGNDADVGAQVRITGNATGTLLRGNLVTAYGGALESVGIWLEDCGGAKPWIVDNQRIDVAGDSHNTRADAIRAVGDCHPVIDSNVLITGAGEDQAADPTAVRCTAAAGIASRCIVVDNLDIRGSISGVPAFATGVRCESGSCVRIANNVITGRGGREAYGVWLQSTGALVDRNVIRGGCSPTAIGIHAEDSWARIQNNRVFGYSQPDCGGATVVATVQSAGLRALTSAGLREIDVHSNFFDGGGPTNAGATCTSRAIALGVTAMSPATSANGVFRNNILRAGTCATRYGFEELAAAADPSALENNDFDPAGMTTTLYFDEAAMALATPTAIDMLAGAAATRSVDPLFVAYPTDLHLQAASMCIDAGTATGAPAWDMDAAPRGNAPDIGPDER